MTYKKQMENLGYSFIGTGGGCDAYLKENKEASILITGYNDSNIPTSRNQKIAIGFYFGEDGWSGEGLFEASCKFSDLLEGKVKLSFYGMLEA